MITQNIKKLKKYLFFISIIFFVLTLWHLSYSYLYNDSKSTAVKWWTLSEALIWNFPTLNPLSNLYTDWNDRYVNQLLYRSILKYDIEQGKIVWDIANCDISSMLNIECIINENAKWSNGENITAEDIIATYNLIKETDSNKVLISLLQNTDIETTQDNTIIFKNKRKDINFLTVFFQPILNKSFIDTLSQENISWNFPINWWIYSWKFIVEKVVDDEKLWIKKLILQKNEFYDKTNISKLTLNIFSDYQSFKNNYQAIDIFNDTDNSVWDSISRFQSHKYTLNSFIWIFLNQNKITNTDLRSYILNKLDSTKLVKVLSEQNYQTVNNPFLTKTSIAREPSNKNFEALMNNLWYKKKSSFLKEITPEVPEVTTSTSITEEEKKPAEIVVPEDLTLDRYQSDSKTIYSPSYVDRFNFVTKDDILLKWNNPEWVTAVYVNDYKLANFKSWDTEFYYRLKESIWNFKTWENNYKIYFEINWEKIFKEELTFFYYSDKEKLIEAEKNLAISIYKKEAEKEQATKTTQKTETTVTAKSSSISQETKDKINTLDENLYYDKNLNPLIFKLYYISDLKTEKEITDTVKFITDSLKELWITVEATAISVKDIASIVTDKTQYDMLLLWVHLWYFDFNLYPYFHSSQATSWNNFSSIKKPALDLLVEEMKENIYTEEKTIEIENKILEILKEEQIMKTLYTPKINLLIWQEVKVEKDYSEIPYKTERNQILSNLYKKEEKEIDWSDKSFWGFFGFLLKKIYE